MNALPTTLVTLEDIHAARARIRTTCLRTPVLDVPHPAGDAPLWLKAESLQRTGSFKLRGAVNAVAAFGHEAKTSAANARIVVEPSGAVATAAVLEHRHRLGSGTTVAVVTGGNIDLQSFASLVGRWPIVD